MEAMTLSDLGPIIAAILGPMVAFVVVSMRYQHQDSTKTRELISNSEKATRDLISNSEKATRDLISNSEKATRDFIERSSNETREETTRQIERATDKLSAEFEKSHDELKRTVNDNHRTTQGQLGKITDSLADARERLAGIEGHLGVARRPRRDDQPGVEDSNAA